ncbi:B-cell receptor CD22-like isoform X6 [Pimephales promelas]|uniref:B-cell receptor CD22-like isoform X6 n=1 Tax=Pimephales promelas TaxID=90988 RepID=UPI001955AB5D|nr:B-cell receptor CD22-like isoform X6 [Pimephales promelas]
MVFLLLSVRTAPPLPLIFMLFMISGVSSVDWGVSYSPTHICALKDSTVTMRCTYTYPPTGYKIKKVFWTKGPLIPGVEPPDLSNDTEYSQRLQYLGDKQQNCTVRLSHVTLEDSHMYYFRFVTNITGGKWTGESGVTLTVTDLQVESPERVTEGDSVSLTCKSSCALTDRATFIWYRNSLKILNESKFRNTLILNPVRREDSGRYSCAVDGHKPVSLDVHLNVMYPPRSVSVSISPSGVIVEGDSVTLNCISDSNPPAEIYWFKGGTIVGSGRIFIISKIRSDDSGEYKCKSINEHGEKYSDNVTLNIMYPPRNVSVLINGSGVIVEGDSVTLKCISDSNPPAVNFSWFKENESSAVGSGQSFSALQSGRFYCQAHNQHGSQRSDTVTVTAQGRDFRYAFAGFAGGLGGMVFVFIIVFIRKKKHRVEHVSKDQDDLYVNLTGGASAHDRVQSESGATNQNDPLYALITLSNFSGDQTKGKASDSEDPDEIQYVTVLHHMKEESESYYDNIRTYHPDAAMRSDQIVTDESVIYSTVK